MNNPFCYQPSPSMLRAQEQLVKHIEWLCRYSSAFAEEVAKGKMFGILLTDSRPLYAFSGQIGGCFCWQGFVPAVFDYLDANGYFKTHEAEISCINRRISALQSSPQLGALRQSLSRLTDESTTDIEAYKLKMRAAKTERDLIRLKGVTSEAQLVRESQFMKAELHRKKLLWKEQIDAVNREIDATAGEIRSLQLQRQHESDSLQQWLFEQFVFAMPDGSRRNLTNIFRDYLATTGSSLLSRGISISAAIPSGTGECCEPKLLHHAFANGLQPLEIGMFWWGESPKQEVRRHLQFYPACNGKCRPILEAMMPSLREEQTCSAYDTASGALRVVFEDDHLLVVDKPAGMLSVPGKGNRPSVLAVLKAMRPDCTELLSVHRLDMDTSGLLVVAKSGSVRKDLQQQFARHSFRKEYVAILDNTACAVEAPQGEVSLPLRPDYADRPRQMVDFIDGKEAITRYQMLPGDNGKRRIRLFPQTGRTHQLRVHCAHRDGLNCPIKGDRLYGKPSDRLYLHAARMEFLHPITNETLTFESAPEW